MTRQQQSQTLPLPIMSPRFLGETNQLEPDHVRIIKALGGIHRHPNWVDIREVDGWWSRCSDPLGNPCLISCLYGLDKEAALAYAYPDGSWVISNTAGIVANNSCTPAENGHKAAIRAVAEWALDNGYQGVC